MAQAAYTTDLTDILTDMSSTTGWSLISTGGGGANSQTAPETDFFIQGQNCTSRNPWSSSIRGMIYNAGSTTIASGDAVYIWLWAGVAAALDTEANGGEQVLIGSSSTAFDSWYVKGSDTYQYGGWICFPIDPTVNPSTTVGSPSDTSYFGARWNVPSSGPSKGFPFAIDAFRHGRDFTCTNGDLANGYATFLDAATFNDYNDATNGYHRYGQFQAIDGGYLMQCRFSMGSAGTAVDFRDSNRNISIADTKFVSSTFNGFEVNNAASNVEWNSVSISALGTTSPGYFTVNDNATVAKNSCSFANMGGFTYDSNTTATSCVWRNCGQIIANSATITDCSISSYSGTSNTSALVWDTNLDPDGYLDGTTFTKGIAGTTHAIEFGTTSLTSMTLTDVNFSGYNASNNQDDSAIHIKRDSGTVTINISGGNGPSYKSDGAEVVIVSDTVNVTLTAQTAAGSPIGSAAVFIKASGVSGPFPVGETVTIANSGTTATVTHTNHGLADNDKVYIDGIGFDDVYSPNWGVFTIDVSDVDTYTYTMTSAPGSSPTGGTSITSTFVILSGTTNGSGQITMSRVFDNDQPFTGWVRKSTTQPYYKEGLVSGTVSSSTGASPVALMVLDE